MYLIILLVGCSNWYGSSGMGQFGWGWRLRKVSLSWLEAGLRGLLSVLAHLCSTWFLIPPAEYSWVSSREGLIIPESSKRRLKADFSPASWISLLMYVGQSKSHGQAQSQGVESSLPLNKRKKKKRERVTLQRGRHKGWERSLAILPLYHNERRETNDVVETSMNAKIVFMCSSEIMSADVYIYKTIMTLKLWIHMRIQ